MQHTSSAIQLSTKSSLSALTAALELFRELKPEMPIQLPLVFLIVAQHKGISSARLCQLTGLSQSSMSRNLIALSKEGSKGEPGLGLIVKTIDPTNPRAHSTYLTKAGRVMAARIAEVLAKGLKVRKVAAAEPQGVVAATALEPPAAFTAVHWEVWT